MEATNTRGVINRFVGILDMEVFTLPACGPPCGCIGGLVQPSFSINNSRPSRGVKPREADDAKTPEGIGLFRLAPEGRRVLRKVHLTRLS